MIVLYMDFLNILLCSFFNYIYFFHLIFYTKKKRKNKKNQLVKSR